MKTAKKIIGMLIMVGAAIMCLCLSGCKANVDVTKTLKVDIKGVNGYGTATLSDEYDWINDVNKSDDELTLLGNEIKFRSAVTYSLDKKDHLSNGDEITVKVTTKEVDGLDVNFTGSDVKIKVEGLKEAETFDPFEGVELVYEGYSPNGSVKVSGGDSSLTYTVDKTSGLKNGDSITVTVKPATGSIESYIEKNDKIYSPDSKEFTVDGLAAYATKLDEIPEDMQSKMKQQAEDAIRAQSANKFTAEGCTLKSADFLGYYFLTAKDSASTNQKNIVYCVYKCTQTLKGAAEGPNNTVLQDQTHDDVFYTWYSFSNVMILPDGTCSADLANGVLCSNQVDATIGYDAFFTYRFYSLFGYLDMDSMTNDVITKNVDKYSYENTVKDTAST